MTITTAYRESTRSIHVASKYNIELKEQDENEEEDNDRGQHQHEMNDSDEYCSVTRECNSFYKQKSSLESENETKSSLLYQR